jgi:putative hydrolase of the HAD superfamily
MIKVILFDCDGPIIKRDKYFSERLVDLGYQLNTEKIQQFFRNEFLLCETGKADLKEELSKRIGDWGYTKSLDELLKFWFEGESATDAQMLEFIKELRGQGIKCYLTTDQEKYRAGYLWESLGLKNYLEAMYSSSSVGFLKTEQSFWTQVFKNMPNISKEEILMLDDDQAVIDSASKFGFNAELYTAFPDFKSLMKAKYKISP